MQHEDDSYDVHVTAAAMMSTQHGMWWTDACFLYHRSDPLALTMCIAAPFADWDNIEWILSRSLLANAFARPQCPCGDGDVRLTYELQSDYMVVELMADDDSGRVPIVVEAEPLYRLLSLSLNLVGPAEELSELNAEIEHLLDGTPE